MRRSVIFGVFVGLRAWLFLLMIPVAADATPHPSLRVVSFAPHVTEILFAIGAEQSLAGVSEQCDYPPRARSLPKVGTYAQPNVESVLAAKPKLAFATEGNNLDVLARLRARGVDVVEVNPSKASELAGVMRLVAQKVGRAQEGEALAGAIEADLKSLRAFAAHKKNKKKSLIVLQGSPLVSATDDTWLGDLFREAGFVNVVPPSRTRYPVVSDEWIVASAPEVVFLTSGVNLANMRKRFEALLGRKRAANVEWVSLPADVFERPGPRIREAFAFLRGRQERPMQGQKTTP